MENKKVCVVGLEPDYSYYKMSELSVSRNNMASTNHGACYITRSIQKIFDADFVNFKDNDALKKINQNYDLCVISMASHFGSRRILKRFSEFVKKIDIKTVFLSGGVDAGKAFMPNISLHRTLLDILDVCSAENALIGVRGVASALYLKRHGYKNVIPIGCPTMYANGKESICTEVRDELNYEHMSVAFHWSIMSQLGGLTGQAKIIGQDIVDEPIFKGKIGSNVINNVSNKSEIDRNIIDKIIKESGIYPEKYEEWYEIIGQQEFLFSGRLHATICSLTQGVPSVLVPWDVRTNEIINHFCIPTVKNGIRDLTSSSLNESFGFFGERIEQAFREWQWFLEENKLSSFVDEKIINHSVVSVKPERTIKDINLLEYSLEPLLGNEKSKVKMHQRVKNKIGRLLNA